MRSQSYASLCRDAEMDSARWSKRYRLFAEVRASVRKARYWNRMHVHQQRHLRATGTYVDRVLRLVGGNA